jgi:3-oxoacyl-[acyl-carrier-protein] synthase II
MRSRCARIAAAQGDLFLVGGSYNAQRPDVLLHYERGQFLWKKAFAGVWARQADGGGMVLGSVGCFLVIESREHAASRGATALAHISAIATDRSRRRPGEATAYYAESSVRCRHRSPRAAVISGAAGIPRQRPRRRVLPGLMPVRATATAFGHSSSRRSPPI